VKAPISVSSAFRQAAARGTQLEDYERGARTIRQPRRFAEYAMEHGLQRVNDPDFDDGYEDDDGDAGRVLGLEDDDDSFEDGVVRRLTKKMHDVAIESNAENDNLYKAAIPGMKRDLYVEAYKGYGEHRRKALQALLCNFVERKYSPRAKVAQFPVSSFWMQRWRYVDQVNRSLKMNVMLKGNRVRRPMNDMATYVDVLFSLCLHSSYALYCKLVGKRVGPISALNLLTLREFGLEAARVFFRLSTIMTRTTKYKKSCSLGNSDITDEVLINEYVLLCETSCEFNVGKEDEEDCD
jgi:hypothetical protein